MWSEKVKTVDATTPLKLGLLGFPIRGVAVTNNTPAYLFLGRTADATRDTALVVVEPYSDYSGALDMPAGGELWAVNGATLGTLTPNAATVIRVTDEPGAVQLSTRRYGRNIIIPLYDGPSGTAGTITTLGTKTQPSPADTSGANLPAYANRRTLYGTCYNSSFQAAGTRLEFSFDGGISWFTAFNLLTADSPQFVYNLDSYALPPLVRFISATVLAASNVKLWAVVDL